MRTLDMLDRNAITRLVKEHQADLWRHLRMLGCDPAQADDLTQETFLTVMEKPIFSF